MKKSRLFLQFTIVLLTMVIFIESLNAQPSGVDPAFNVRSGKINRFYDFQNITIRRQDSDL